MSLSLPRRFCGTTIPGSRRAYRRQGAVVLEAIIGIPILVIAIFGMFLLGMMLIVRSGVQNAALEAAREASKAFGTTGYDQVDSGQCPPLNSPPDPAVDAAVDAVNRVLGVYGLSVGPTGGTSGVQVIVIDEATSTYRGESIVADSVICTDVTGDPSTVRVRVVVRYSAIPIPDLLNTFGLSISGQTFDASASARRCLCVDCGLGG